jgi:hypothetical protein
MDIPGCTRARKYVLGHPAGVLVGRLVVGRIKKTSRGKSVLIRNSPTFELAAVLTWVCRAEFVVPARQTEPPTITRAREYKISLG